MCEHLTIPAAWSRMRLFRIRQFLLVWHHLGLGRLSVCGDTLVHLLTAPIRCGGLQVGIIVSGLFVMSCLTKFLMVPMRL